MKAKDIILIILAVVIIGLVLAIATGMFANDNPTLEDYKNTTSGIHR